jgi:hypothetical protein
MKLNEKQLEYVNTAYEMFSSDTLEKSQIKQVNAKLGMKSSPAWLIKDPQFRLTRGVYRLPVNGLVNPSKNAKQVSIPEVKQKISKQIQTTESTSENLIPNKEETFVPFGNYKDLKNIVKSGIFYPTFITGLSGNGKTLGVQQSCAELKREMIRVNITIETDEDDLLGGFRLQDGETVWHDGPVVNAMKKGAVLLLDEIDLASNKIMCLQPVLEGNGIFLKKIGQFVEPQDGFQIFATANTKGKGSDDGRFIGTNILNEAFLERFPVTFEQAYPTAKIETKILDNVMNHYGLKDTEFTSNLVKWADVIRRTFFDGGIDEIIATRRLVHIVNAYAIFKNKLKAVEVCINRFDDDTKNSFLDLYTKVDSGVNIDELNQGSSNDSEESEDNLA